MASIKLTRQSAHEEAQREENADSKRLHTRAACAQRAHTGCWEEGSWCTPSPPSSLRQTIQRRTLTECYKSSLQLIQEKGSTHCLRCSVHSPSPLFMRVL